MKAKTKCRVTAAQLDRACAELAERVEDGDADALEFAAAEFAADNRQTRADMIERLVDAACELQSAD